MDIARLSQSIIVLNKKVTDICVIAGGKLHFEIFA